MKCFNCGGEGHFARECPSCITSYIQSKEKEEVAITEIPETTTEMSSATNAEDSVTWPEIVRTQETDQEDTIAKTEETDTKEITQELRALDAIIVRSTVTWQETARLVSIKIQRKKAGMLQLWKVRSLRS